MTRIHMLLAAASTAALLALPTAAQAQSYYIRERVMPRPQASTPTPTPTSTPTPAPAGAAWDAGTWSAWSSDCSAAATRTRSVTCKQAGAPVADTQCVSARPNSAETTERLEGCTYSAVNWSTTSWSSTCSASATQTEVATCQRSDMTTAAATDCTSRGVSVMRTTTASNYSGCTGAWAAGSYGNWSACSGGKSTRTATPVCKVNGQVVSDSMCSPASRPADQVQESSCSHSCSALTDQRKVPYGGSERVLGSIPTGTSLTSALAQAQAMCNATIVAGSYAYRLCGVTYYPGSDASGNIRSPMGVVFYWSNAPFSISNEGPGYSALSSCTQ